MKYAMNSGYLCALSFGVAILTCCERRVSGRELSKHHWVCSVVEEETSLEGRSTFNEWTGQDLVDAPRDSVRLIFREGYCHIVHAANEDRLMSLYVFRFNENGDSLFMMNPVPRASPPVEFDNQSWVRPIQNFCLVLKPFKKNIYQAALLRHDGHSFNKMNNSCIIRLIIYNN
jgi:hypothetical protein